MSTVPSIAVAILRSSETFQCTPTPRQSHGNLSAISLQTRLQVAGPFAVVAVGQQDGVRDVAGTLSEQSAANSSQAPIAVPPLACKRSSQRSAAARVCGDETASSPGAGNSCWAVLTPAMMAKRTPSSMQSTAALAACRAALMRPSACIDPDASTMMISVAPAVRRPVPEPDERDRDDRVHFGRAQGEKLVLERLGGVRHGVLPQLATTGIKTTVMLSAPPSALA